MNVFDLIGPIMIGPSSSHTAGAVRIGQIAGLLLKNKPVSCIITLSGSFARTYQGHGTDRALVAGILGYEVDDERIKNSLNLAQQAGIQVEFVLCDLPNTHPNTALIHLTDAMNHSVEVQGASVGGGAIQIEKVNGLSVCFTGLYPTLIVVHQDMPGVISEVTKLLAKHHANINNFSLSRTKKGGTAIMTIELDHAVQPEIVPHLEKLDYIQQVTLIEKEDK